MRCGNNEIEVVRAAELSCDPLGDDRVACGRTISHRFAAVLRDKRGIPSGTEIVIQ